MFEHLWSATRSLVTLSPVALLVDNAQLAHDRDVVIAGFREAGHLDPLAEEDAVGGATEVEHTDHVSHTARRQITSL